MASSILYMCVFACTQMFAYNTHIHKHNGLISTIGSKTFLLYKWTVVMLVEHVPRALFQSTCKTCSENSLLTLRTYLQHMRLKQTQTALPWRGPAGRTSQTDVWDLGLSRKKFCIVPHSMTTKGCV